ncbi:MAG: polysaccharide deacetylase family protein [Propionibacteriales bacterium]|nr:polysaccharide deacetylase family protein [Propionibacteriales bacterium]
MSNSSQQRAESPAAPNVIGYAFSGDLPVLPELRGGRLVVSLVINVETWPFDQPMPRKLITAPHGTENIPDVPNFSWVEYGMRVGLPRMLRAFADRNLPGGISMNAAVVDDYPRAFQALVERGWEFIGHGVRQQSLHAATDEEDVVTTSLSMLEEHTGVRPRGWLGPGLQETFRTPDILAGCGVEYVLDWCVDEVPTVLTTSGKPLVAVPYNLELNDSVVFAVERQSAREWSHRVRDTLDLLAREAQESPRVLSLPLHPHLLGVPHRFQYLVDVLDLLLDREDTVFATPAEICDWFLGSQ